MARNQIKSGAVLGYIKMFLGVAVAFVYTPIMLRYLGKSEYGLYSLVASTVGYLSVLDMGFGNAIVRFTSKAKARNEKKKEARLNGLFLVLYVIIGIIALITGAVLFANINNLYGEKLSTEELGKARIIMGILVATVALSFPLSVFDSFVVTSEKFGLLRIVDIIKTILYPLIIVPLLMMGYKSIAMVVVTSVLTLACHLYMMYYCFAKIHTKIEFRWDKESKKAFRRICNYSFFIFLAIIVDTIFNNTDQVILGSVCGTATVAVYAVAAKIASINMNFSTTISGLFLPRVTKLLEGKDGDKEVSNLFLRVSRIQLFMMAFILSMFIVVGREFVILWAGEEYEGAYDITLLLIGPSIVPLTQNVALAVIQAKNKHRFRAIVYLIIAGLNVGVTIPLSRIFGGAGAAMGTALANLLGQIIIMNIYYSKVIKLNIAGYWKNFCSFSVRIAILVAVFMLCKVQLGIQAEWWTFLVMVAVFSVLYVFIAYMFMNEEEKGYVKAITSRIKKKR